MKRRSFLKITMGTLGSAMGLSAVKAEVIGPDIIESPPITPITPCEGIKPWHFNAEHPSNKSKKVFIGVDLASGPDSTVIYERTPYGKS